jgi:hypothetical protein
VSERESPVSKIWKRAKESAPRQKAIASTIRAVRRGKPTTAAKAREALIAEAARHGVTDLSDKELATMTDAVTMSAKEAASSAVTKGTAGAKSLWSSLQISLQATKPSWIELPDDIAALNLRSDQERVPVTVVIEVPDVAERLTDDLAPDEDGERHFNVWVGTDPNTHAAAVCVGRERLGRVPDEHVAPIREELARRRFWVRATMRDGAVLVNLPDRP